MFQIVEKKQFSEKVFLFKVEAPLIARSRKAGHFVIVRVGKQGERMPLTIADADPERGTITLVVQKVGLSSTKLCNLEVGDSVEDVVGPLGNAISRRAEYRADTYAAIHGHGEALISGLKKLASHGLSNLTPHPLVVWFNYSHPTLAQRIRAIRQR